MFYQDDKLVVASFSSDSTGGTEAFLRAYLNCE